MVADPRKLEHRALILSAVGALFMSAMGFGFAVLTRSEAIMLDGIFSLLGFVMALAAIYISRLVYKPGNSNFQFGYAGFEPLFNVVKGMIIIFISILALYYAVMAIKSGGREIAIGWALVYAIITSLGCFIISAMLAHYAKKTNSPLLKVDAKNWLIDGLITTAILIGFILAYLAENTQWEWAIPYTDPVVVLVLIVFSLPVPYLIIKEGLKELLLGAPSLSFQQKLYQNLELVLEDNKYKAADIRISKTGRMLYVYIFVLLHEEQADTPISTQDEIRKALTLAASEFYPDVEVDLFLTRDENLAHFNQT